MKYTLNEIKKNKRFLHDKQAAEKLGMDATYVRSKIKALLDDFNEKGWLFFIELRGGRIFSNDPENCRYSEPYQCYFKIENKYLTENRIAGLWVDHNIVKELETPPDKRRGPKPGKKRKPKVAKEDLAEVDFVTPIPLAPSAKIDARKLYKHLGVKRDYLQWINQTIHQIERLHSSPDDQHGRFGTGKYWLTMSAMQCVLELSNAEKAHQAREYFAECLDALEAELNVCDKKLEQLAEKKEEETDSPVVKEEDHASDHRLESYLPIKDLRRKYPILEQAFQDPVILRDTLLSISDHSDLPAMQLRRNGNWETVIHPSIAKKLLLTERDITT